MEVLLAVLVTAAVAWSGMTLRGRLARGRSLPHASSAAPTASGAVDDDTVFEVMPLAALRVDAQERVVAVNARAVQWFPHLRTGVTVLETFGEHQLADAVRTCIGDFAAQQLEVRLFSADRRTYRVQVEPRRVAGEAEALVYLNDLTEAVAYQELRAQFVANVSHELRTPLTGLGGLVEALADPDMDAATHARFVERASREIRRLDALITDILFLSELESQPSRRTGERSNLAAAIIAAQSELAEAAARQDVGLRVMDVAATWVPLTELMSHIVVRNLMENAVRYAGPGAVATVDIRPVATPVGRSGRWVELTVADDGVGIPERHLPHVIERFYRVDSSRSAQMGGTGLGLSIVKHIAERFGGGLTPESREGFGTTMRVLLPVVDPPTGDALDDDEDPDPT